MSMGMRMVYTVRCEGTLQFGEAQRGERKNFGGDGWVNCWGWGWGWMEDYFRRPLKSWMWMWMWMWTWTWMWMWMAGSPERRMGYVSTSDVSTDQRIGGGL